MTTKRRATVGLATAAVAAFALATGGSARPLQTPGVTLRAAPETVVYGKETRLLGQIALPLAEQTVVVHAKEHGERAFLPIGIAETDAVGQWSYRLAPTVATVVRAEWQRNRSESASVGVRPRLTLVRRHGGLLTRAIAARSYRGKFVWFQRRTRAGKWVSIRRVRLSNPPQRFEVRLPPGRRWPVRVFLPRGQAGPGYLPAVSRVILIGSAEQQRG